MQGRKADMLEKCFSIDEWVEKKDRYVCKQQNDTNNEYSEELSQDMINVEDRSWWFLYRIKLLKAIVSTYFSAEKYVLDIGGGNGVMSKALQDLGYKAYLLEPSEYCCNSASKRRINYIFQGTLNHKNVIDSSIEQFMMNDVLEHIEDDEDFLKLLYSKMEKGGRGIIMVPAMKVLWSSEDSYDGHFRRYSMREMVELVEAAGFKVLYKNYFFQFLFLPILIVRTIGEKIGVVKKHEARNQVEIAEKIDRQFIVDSRLVNRILQVVEGAELRRVLKRKILYGSSLFVVIEK